MEIKIFDTSLEKFLISLEKNTRAKVLRTIDLLEVFGNNLGMPHSKKLAKDLFELRIRGKQEVRILYTFHRNQIIVLHGFIKKTPKIPLNELKTAVNKLKSINE